MSAQSSHPWEPWQLTAYVLGELEVEETQRLASTIASDSALAREVAELAATLKDVRAVYRQEKLAQDKLCGLDEPSVSALLAARGAEANGAEDVGPAEPVRSRRKRSLGLHRSVWLSLAAMLLVAISLGVLWRSTIQPEAGPTTLARIDSSDWNSAEQLQEEAAVESLQASFGQRESNAQHEPITRLNSTDLPAASAPAHSLQSGAVGLAADSVGDLEGRTTLSVSPNSIAQRSAQPNAGMGMGDYGAMSYGASAPTEGAGGYGAGGYGGGVQSSGAPSSVEGEDRYVDAMSDGADAAPSSRSEGESLFSNMMGEPASDPAQGVSADQSGRGRPADFAMRGAGGMGGMGGYGRGGAVHDARVRGATRSAGMGYGGGRYIAGDQFAPISENSFAPVQTDPLSTFSIDADTASFAKARQYLLEHRQMPPGEAVRIEEFINYFDYDYPGPGDDTPFASALAVAQCPWKPEHKLVRIALQAKKIDLSKRPKANLVFLLDVSGSMDEPNKLPLVKETMRLLTYQLGENDRVAMVVYAGAAGCVLESTRGDQQDQILSAIERLSAGGSTNGGEGIKLAYRLARDHLIPGGINRVILCTDGDFNVGVTGTEELVNLVAEQAKSNVFLTVLGYGIGNTNDAMMEEVSNRGNGVYGFVDSRAEAQRQMVKQLTGNLMTVAKDVKIQVEFNPAMVRSYRLIGYENRRLAAEDFHNDQKDAGEIGAGHRVTALYEIVPTVAGSNNSSAAQPLKYQPTAASEPVPRTGSRELLTVNLRYKEPEGDKSSLLTFPLEDSDLAYTDADRDFRWAAAMAEFGMLLRNSQHKGTASWDSLIGRARMAVGSEPDSARSDCLEMIRTAAQNSQERDRR